MKEFRIRLSSTIWSSWYLVDSMNYEPPFLHSLYPQEQSIKQSDDEKLIRSFHGKKKLKSEGHKWESYAKEWH